MIKKLILELIAIVMLIIAIILTSVAIYEEIKEINEPTVKYVEKKEEVEPVVLEVIF